MKVLWVNTNFMHPTTKGGQIRTLEMLRWLHRWHEIHYVAIAGDPEGPRRAGEYSFRAYPYDYPFPSKTAAALRGLFSPVPVAVARFHPPGLGPFLEQLIRKERFDTAVVDHLAPTAYFPDLEHAVFFQHNVETVIWRRNADHAPDPLRRAYFRLQAGRMYAFERRVSRAAGHIAAVSATDAKYMRDLFHVDRVTEIPTGVNLEYFRPPPTPVSPAPASADLVFVGSMDWLANIDGVSYFVEEILPLIRRRRPDCTLAVVGRTPPPKITALAQNDPGIIVTGTVPDIRPYFWNGKVSIVPLRIGGGTRLKIYEAMAAKIPVVSTSVGAEGLEVHDGQDIHLADTPADFAARCLHLLEDSDERGRMATAASELVSTRFSWEHAARCFEKILINGPRLT